MGKFEKYEKKIWSDEKFDKIDKIVARDLDIRPDNALEKSLEMTKLIVKYRREYFKQKQLLNNINSDIKATKMKRFHYYKHDYDYALDNNTSRLIHVDGDDEMRDLCLLGDRQTDIVEYLKNTISDITNTSYRIQNFIALEKLRNGVM